MKVKVCGMRQMENIKDITALQPDRIGLIFYAKSKRFVSQDDSLLKCLDALDPYIEKVGVFVNESLSEILEKAKLYGLRIIQLHGEESTELVDQLKEVNLKVVKAIPVGAHIAWEEAAAFAKCCDELLFDTASPLKGGTGVKFDWDHLNSYPFDTPWWLSGGIGGEDAAKIKAAKFPHIVGVDINSRFETQPAIKDAQLVNQFIQELRS